MTQKSLSRKNFLSLLAFGVMFLAAFAVLSAVNNPPSLTTQAHAPR